MPARTRSSPAPRPKREDPLAARLTALRPDIEQALARSDDEKVARATALERLTAMPEWAWVKAVIADTFDAHLQLAMDGQAPMEALRGIQDVGSRLDATFFVGLKAYERIQARHTAGATFADQWKAQHAATGLGRPRLTPTPSGGPAS